MMSLPLTEAEPDYAYFEALDYRASFLIEKLLKERIVDTAAEGEALFREVKRFIVLVRTDTSKLWDMYSLRVDEVWHQFVLFTAEYIEFCARYFGVYIQHSPSNAPAPDLAAQEDRPPSTFPEFERRYAELFAEPLPDIWRDETSVVPHRRVLNDHAGKLKVHRDGPLVTLTDAHGHLVLSINDLAYPALAFIARTGAFYVRELPGELSEDEKVALVATLVEFHLLRVGA
jgi:hypothetical protein